MASLTVPEFNEAVTLLAERMGVGRLRDKLGALGAFTSRKGLNSAEAIAERLYQLSGGLRRQVIATYAFTSLWTDQIGQALGDDGTKRLEELADKVNVCLTSTETIVEGKEEELDTALSAYREALAAAAGPAMARLDMLLKAVPQVADRLRSTGSPGA